MARSIPRAQAGPPVLLFPTNPIRCGSSSPRLPLKMSLAPSIACFWIVSTASGRRGRQALTKTIPICPRGATSFTWKPAICTAPPSQQGDYELTVLPPWYSAWWLYVVAVTAGAGVGGALVGGVLSVLGGHKRAGAALG